MAMSAYLKNELLDAVINAGSFAVTTVYVSLHTADPSTSGANEVTGGSYARQTASFGAASGGAGSNDAQVEFTLMPSCTITHVGLWDAVTAGNWLWGGALAASKVVNSGDTVRFATGDLDVDLNS